MIKITIASIAASLLLMVNSSYALSDKEIYDSYKNSYNYEKMYRYQDSIKSLAGVYKGYPSAYTVNLRLGWLYYLSGDYANSVFHYQNAMKVAPYYIEAKIGYMVPLLAQQKYQEAEEIGNKVLKVDYFNYYGNYRLILAMKYQKKYNLTEKIINKMLYIYPTDTLFLTELANIKDLKGEKKDALKIARSIVTLEPTNTYAVNYIRYKK